jgi:hypothetical protein
MKTHCLVLKLYKSARGTAAILDFPEKVSPYVGLPLRKENSDFVWKVIGTSPPILLSLLDSVTFATKYNHEMVWDCILEPQTRFGELNVGDILEVEHEHHT